MDSDTQSERETGTQGDERTLSRSTRAQTTLDFTIGVTIFIIVIAAVFLFVPGTLQPFSQGGQEDIVTVNRIADDLGEQSLAQNGTPHVLNATCTDALFNDSNTNCGFSSSDIRDNLGLTSDRNANVTIIGDLPSSSGGTEVLCLNPDADPGNRTTTQSCTSGQVRLAAGDDAAVTGSSVTARRVVELDGNDVFLVVKVW